MREMLGFIMATQFGFGPTISMQWNTEYSGQARIETRVIMFTAHLRSHQTVGFQHFSLLQILAPLLP